jgi:putative acetyltransferase
MTAREQPKLGLRPYLPGDAPLLAEIFRASVEELTGDDYDPGQQAAWVAAADDEDAFAKRLAGALTLVAIMQGAPVGFASLAGAEEIDMLYVHPAAARQGVADLLVDALEKLAAGRGAKRLKADASEHRARLLRASRLHRPATQHGTPQRRMARQYDGRSSARRPHDPSRDPVSPPLALLHRPQGRRHRGGGRRCAEISGLLVKPKGCR